METILINLLHHLENSRESLYATETPEELLKIISLELNSVRKTGKLSKLNQMVILFLPTGSLQKIAMDNGWGDEYLVLAKSFDQGLKECR
jgi:hypothetical protein